MIHLHQVLFGKIPPRISDNLKEGLESIGRWFVEELLTYIKVFVCEVGPHLLPQYILESLALIEVANQAVLYGQAKKLSKLQKKLWHNFPIKFGDINILENGHEIKEAEELKEIWLFTLPHNHYDPQGFIGNHYIPVNYIKKFIDQEPPSDVVFICIDDF